MEDKLRKVNELRPRIQKAQEHLINARVNDARIEISYVLLYWPLYGG